jgi:hypothetical protein
VLCGRNVLRGIVARFWISGELLREIEPAQGGVTTPGAPGSAPSPVSRKSAADAAGMSERQRKTAILVTGIPKEQFRAEIESTTPRTIAAGRRENPQQRNKQETNRKHTKPPLAHDEGDKLTGETMLPFGARTAQMLMKVSEEPLLANPNRGSDLPPSWRTLYELTKLPDGAACCSSAWRALTFGCSRPNISVT